LVQAVALVHHHKTVQAVLAPLHQLTVTHLQVAEPVVAVQQVQHLLAVTVHQAVAVVASILAPVQQAVQEAKELTVELAVQVVWAVAVVVTSLLELTVVPVVQEPLSTHRGESQLVLVKT
jgi:hypothetical protein